MTPRRPRGARLLRRYALLLDPFTSRRIGQIIKRCGLRVEHCSVETLLAACDAPSNVAIVFDPALLEPSQLYTVLVQLSASPRAAIAYSSLTPLGVDGALEVARHSTALVVFQRLDEDTTALSRALVGIADPAFTRVVLDGLQPRLTLVPRAIASAVVGAFVHESTPTTPIALAHRAFTARRSLDRWFDRVGIVSTRMLMLMPVMLRALTLLQQSAMSLTRVARLAGYNIPRRLMDHSLELTGMSPVELRAMPDPMRAVQLMLERTTRPLDAAIAGRYARSLGIDATPDDPDAPPMPPFQE